jgi:Uma2 family endonuclease
MLVTERPFTRTEYHRMAETGVLAPDEQVELLDGRIVRMAPVGPFHGGTTDFLAAALARSIGARAIIRVQGPVALSKKSEPQPDVALLRPRPDFYRSAHPQPEDVLLLIEVAESSLDMDLNLKARLYAQAGISEYWVVDLGGRRIVLHRGPSSDGYTDVSDAHGTARVSPAAFPEVSLSVAECLGG